MFAEIAGVELANLENTTMGRGDRESFWGPELVTEHAFAGLWGRKADTNLRRSKRAVQCARWRQTGPIVSRIWEIRIVSRVSWLHCRDHSFSH